MFLSYGERRINVICILYVVERIPIQYLYSISLSVSGPIDSTFLSGKDLEVSQAQAEAEAEAQSTNWLKFQLVHSDRVRDIELPNYVLLIRGIL